MAPAVSVAAAVMVLVMGGTAATAGANVGVGITARTITLGNPAVAGQSYKLAGVYVVNTGTQASAIHVRVADLEHTKHHVIPAAWVTFHPSTVTLAAKKGTVIPMTVVVPRNAAVGSYQSDLVAGATSAGARSGTATQVGAAAATRMTFTVVAPKPSSGLHIPSWVWIALAVAAGLALIVWVVRASGLRLHVERRGPSDE